ncbi:MAG: hypothetical protein R3B45_06405 [Bdellovibrionota bacterium]
MGKLIQFPQNAHVGKNILKLKEVSDKFDAILVQALEEDIDPNELSGLIAHRLGSLMRNLDEKSKLWLICENILKKQANIS